jgi:hypothetical protein
VELELELELEEGEEEEEEEEEAWAGASRWHACHSRSALAIHLIGTDAGGTAIPRLPRLHQ